MPTLTKLLHVPDLKKLLLLPAVARLLRSISALTNVLFVSVALLGKPIEDLPEAEVETNPNGAVGVVNGPPSSSSPSSSSPSLLRGNEPGIGSGDLEIDWSAPNTFDVFRV
jgi:hypothetical protein